MQPTVLIVDDEEDLRVLLAASLKNKLLVDVLCASSKQEAISVIQSHPSIKVIVCDYYLPDGTGGEVFQFIKNQNLPISFALCSGEQPEFHPEFKTAPPDGFLMKPFQRREILKTIQALLASHPS